MQGVEEHAEGEADMVSLWGSFGGWAVGLTPHGLGRRVGGGKPWTVVAWKSQVVSPNPGHGKDSDSRWVRQTWWGLPPMAGTWGKEGALGRQV